MNNPVFKKILISLGAGVLCAVISLSGILGGFEHYITDPAYQRPIAPDSRIKIVGIDEKSLNEIGAFGTWSRDTYADLLNVLYEDETCAPSLVVFDVIFQGDTDPEADATFADAARAAGGVICGTNMVFRDAIETDENGRKYLNRFHTELVEYPYDSLREHSRSGFVDSVQDEKDTMVREFYQYLSDGENAIPSLAVATATELEERGLIEVTVPRALPGRKMMLRYSTRPGDFETISFTDVLNRRIPKEVFRDNILLVGAYAPGMMDAFNVPTGHGEQMYGVEIHANILMALQNGRYMERAGSATTALIYGVLGAVLAFLAQILPLAALGVLEIVVLVFGVFAGVGMAERHVFFPLIMLPLILILALAGAICNKYLSSLMQRRKILRAFRQYVAPQIVEEISKKGDYVLKLGGEKRDIAVLFVDIRGFTPLSEALSPEQVVEVLNEYLSLTTKSIFDNLGTLDKFVGDATMAVFNSPFDLDDYVFRAVCAARDIVNGSEDIRRKAFEMTGKTVGFGVGVNCGEAVVGNIGCDFRMDYTAIGDTVNTAARLEANAKAGQVLISQNVVDILGDRIKTNCVGDIPLKGKSVPLTVYELVEVIG